MDWLAWWDIPITIGNLLTTLLASITAKMIKIVLNRYKQKKN